MNKQKHRYLHRYFTAAVILLFIGSAIPSSVFAQNHATVRVILAGFLVNRPTIEGLIDNYGPGDEVTLVNHVGRVDRFGTFTRLTWGNSFSSIIGANPPNPIRGGTSNNATGGFRIGDSFPTGYYPPARNAPLTSGIPPTVLFEGDLTDGWDAAVVIPTIWEWDGPDGVLQRSYADAIDRAVDGISLTTYREARSNVHQPVGLVDGLTAGITNTMLLGYGYPVTRPIGVTPVGNRFGFTPQLFIVTYSIAKRAQSLDIGFGRGIIPVRYTDDASFGGDYTLFLQIETEEQIPRKKR